MEQILTAQQAKSARLAAQLSQGGVASTLGINRTYLSLFESGKYIFDDTTLTRMRSLYEERGASFEEPANFQASEFTEPGQADMPYLRDGFLIPSETDQEKVETLLAEYADNRATIAKLCDYNIRENSFLFLDNSEVRTRTTEVLALMAKNYTIVETLHGHEAVLSSLGTASNGQKNTTGDFLNDLLYAI